MYIYKNEDDQSFAKGRYTQRDTERDTDILRERHRETQIEIERHSEKQKETQR